MNLGGCVRMRRFALLGILALAFAVGAGCALQKPIHKDWVPVGGSKSDATVKLAYSWVPAKEIPQVSQNQAAILATSKCQTWGYEKAEPFGGVLTNMTGYDVSGWPQMTATQEFQCVGGTTMTATPPPARGREVRGK